MHIEHNDIVNLSPLAAISVTSYAAASDRNWTPCTPSYNCPLLCSRHLAVCCLLRKSSRGGFGIVGDDIS